MNVGGGDVLLLVASAALVIGSAPLKLADHIVQDLLGCVFTVRDTI